MKNSKKYLGLSLVPLIFIACGGGGGGGGTTPNIPHISKNDINIDFTNVGRIDISNNKPTPYPTIRKNVPVKSVYPFENITPIHDENMVREIGIIDSDFHPSISYKNRLIESKPNKFDHTGLPITDWEADINSHGTFVASVIDRGINNRDKKIHAIRASLSRGADDLLLNSDMYEELFINGARIFNHSYGEKIPAGIAKEKGVELDITKQFYEFYPVDKQSIHVWAAGNEGRNFTTAESLYPDFNEKFKNSFVAVTAINSGDKKRLARYANKIGEVAKTWGIAAVGNKTLDILDKRGQSHRVTKFGTSFATPEVTATISNIWDKYPWMDNHLVLVSLFSTADKRGTDEVTTGPDRDFGWGLLNKDRALKGPARFDSRLLTKDRDIINNKPEDSYLKVHLDYRDYKDRDRLRWSNDIIGDVGLYKTGTGLLELSGNNSYRGNTLIEDGVLHISNSLENRSLDIKSKGILLAKSDNGRIYIKSKYDIHNEGSIYVYGKGLIVDSDIKSDKGSKIVIDIKDSDLIVTKNLDLKDSTIIADIQNLQDVPKSSQNNRDIIKAKNILNYDGSYSISSKINPFIKINSLEQIGNKINVDYSRNNLEYVLNKVSHTSSYPKELVSNLENALETISLNNKKSVSATALLNTAPNNIDKAVLTTSGQIHMDSSLFFRNKILWTSFDIGNHLFNNDYSDNISASIDNIYSKYKLNSKKYLKNSDISTNSMKLKVNNNIFGAELEFGKAEIKTGYDDSNNVNFQSLSAYLIVPDDKLNLFFKVGLGRYASDIKRFIIDSYTRTEYITFNYDFLTEMSKNFYLTDYFIFSPFINYQIINTRRDNFYENADFGIIADKYNDINSYLGLGVRGGLKFSKLSVNSSISNSVNLNNNKKEYGVFKESGTGTSLITRKDNKNITFLNLEGIYNISDDMNIKVSYQNRLDNLKMSDRKYNISLNYNF